MPGLLINMVLKLYALAVYKYYLYGRDGYFPLYREGIKKCKDLQVWNSFCESDLTDGNYLWEKSLTLGQCIFIPPLLFSQYWMVTSVNPGIASF